MTTHPTRKVRGSDLDNTMVLVGESGGLSAIYDNGPSSAMPGLALVETEHGPLYLDPDQEYDVYDEAQAEDINNADGSAVDCCIYEDDDLAEFDGYDDDEMSTRAMMFADPGGRSALRAASHRNPRNLPCPTCGEPNRLTPADQARSYQCDACADAAERGF